MVVEIKLPKPHLGQQQVINSSARWRILLCGRRWGKSLVARIEAIKHMLKGNDVAYVTPTFDLAKTFYNLIVESLPDAIIKTNNKSELFIELITGGSIKFYSGEALERFRGHNYDFIIIDEAAFIPNLKEEWNSSIRPTLSDRMGTALFISTPKGKEFFFSLFQKGQERIEGYESFHFASDTNPYFPQEEFEQAKASLPRMVFNQEYLAIAGENQNNPFGTDNINRNIIQSLSTEPTIVYGIDLAKYNDYTVVVGLDMQGNMTYYDRYQLPWALTQQRIEQLPSNILKVVDSTGVGDVVLENLYQTCQNITGFKFTTESKPKIIYQLIKDVEQGNVKYNQITADEMHIYEYKYSSTGHISFNAQAGYHDDSICAMAIANHFKTQAVQNQDWKLYFV